MIPSFHTSANPLMSWLYHIYHVLVRYTESRESRTLKTLHSFMITSPLTLFIALQTLDISKVLCWPERSSIAQYFDVNDRSRLRKKSTSALLVRAVVSRLSHSNILGARLEMMKRPDTFRCAPMICMYLCVSMYLFMYISMYVYIYVCMYILYVPYVCMHVCMVPYPRRRGGLRLPRPLPSR